MNTRYTPWNEVKAKSDSGPRTDQENAATQATAHERLDARRLGHQLAAMRHAAGTTQAELAQALNVTQARISKIEHGEISGIDTVHAYIAALTPAYVAERYEKGQEWFWTPEWLTGELEADRDMEAGRVTVFNSEEDFLDALGGNDE